jgi:hypothetical protein
MVTVVAWVDVDWDDSSVGGGSIGAALQAFAIRADIWQSTDFVVFSIYIRGFQSIRLL